MIYNLLTTSAKNIVLSAYSANELTLYYLEEYQYTIFDSFLDKNDFPTVPFEALAGTCLKQGFTKVNNQKYIVYSTTLDLTAIPKWEFGSVYGIVSCKDNDIIVFRVIDLSALMKQYQTKNIIDAYLMWRNQQADQVNSILYGILIVTSATRLIQTNIYIELMNKTSRELSLHLAKVYYSSKQLLEHIYNRVIRSVDTRHSSEDIHAFVAFNTTRSELNNFVTYINYPYVVNVNLDNVDSGKLDYSTVGCQGFGDLTIQNSCGRILLLHPNASLVGDFQNRAITLNWLISKTYSLD